MDMERGQYDHERLDEIMAAIKGEGKPTKDGPPENEAEDSESKPW